MSSLIIPVDPNAPRRLAPHRVELAHGWTLWRAICVRGAGFAVESVIDLAAPAAAKAVDEWLARQDTCEALQQQALLTCEEGNRLGAPCAGSALTRAIKQLKANKIPEPFEATQLVREAIERYADALGRAQTQADAVKQVFAEAVLATGARLRQAAKDPRMRAAMLWQNRNAVKGTVDALLRKPAGAVDSKTREHERLVASYLQRYCTKNDTIGFFGPVGWGSIDDAERAIELHVGTQLLRKRSVYFETWGVQLLAATLAADPELRPHVVPRRMPTVRLEGNVLLHSAGRATELPSEYASLIGACDGERTAAEIAALVCSDEHLALSGPQEVFGLLEQLVEKRVLTWSLEIPTTLARPEQNLRQQLARAPECEARTRALAIVDEFETLRTNVAAAGEDERPLDDSIAALDLAFERVTGTAAQRRGGQAYAGRTLLFEDCVRDVDLRLGRALIDRLAPALTLLLQAARWYTFEVGRRYLNELSAVHARLRAETGNPSIELLHFLSQVEDLFSGSQTRSTPLVQSVIQELHARWAQVLQLPTDARRVERSAAELQSAVEQIFAAPHPGWPGARYHSPDVMIAAPSVEAIARGEYTLVLGELHTGDNTASNPVFIHQHPDASELVRCVEHDLQEPRISPVVPKERSTRADQLSISRRDFEVEFGTTRSARPRSQVIPAAELVVDYTDDTLYVRTRDGRLRFHVLAFFENYLKLESIAHFTLLAKATHVPRVTIDGVVVARERWVFDSSEFGFASRPEPLERFVATRRWVAQHGLPRLVFVKSPEETKPCFVDFDSPVFVEIFAKLARRAAWLSLSEMLPAVDQTWLVDHAGHSYTSELRLVAVDPQTWRAP